MAFCYQQSLSRCITCHRSLCSTVTRQLNGCSTPAPRSRAAKQWFKQLAQKKEVTSGKRPTVIKRTLEDLWPCYCYVTKDNSRTIGSEVWQLPFAGKRVDIANCKLHDTRTVSLAVVQSVSYRKIYCYCKK